MSSETSSVVISICAIAAIAGVAIMLAGLLVVRIFKSSLFGMAMMAFKIVGEPKEESSALDARSQSVSRQRRNLRAQAQSVDFDSAVARHGGKQTTQTTPTTPPAANPFATGTTQAVNPQQTDLTNQYPSLNKRRLHQRADEGEDLDFLDALGDDD